MTTAAVPRRRADAARNDELLLDAGLELLREKGPDRLTALELARRAGLTTGAVYARYENNEEILVGLWQQRLREPLRQFFTDSVSVLNGDRSTPDAVMASLTDPRSPLLTAVSLLIATPRISELSEVVIPDVQEMLHDLGVDDDCRDPAPLGIIGALSTGVGCLYFAAADMFHIDDWPIVRSLIRSFSSGEPIESDSPLEPVVPSDLVVDTGNTTRDALVNAAAGVIARSGLERATTQRVARAANLPPSALFSEYQNRQALFADVASKLLREIYHEHRIRVLFRQEAPPPESTAPLSGWDDPRLRAFRKSMVGSVAASMMGLLSPPGSAHRRIRLEFQLAAIHNADIRAQLKWVDDGANAATIGTHVTAFNLPESIAGPGTRVARAIAQGAMLLEDVSHMINGRDIRSITGALADFSCSMALGLPTEPTSATPSLR